MITRYDSFFSEEVFLDIKKHINDLMTNKSTAFMTSMSWQDGLKGNSGLIARYSFDSSDIGIYKSIRKEIESKTHFFVNTGVIHILPPLSYITWHSDPHCKAALTIYLNDKWNDDWGGYLMYNEKDEIKAIKPERNLGVLQQTPVNHCVSTVNVGADNRVSLQFFLTDVKKNMV